MSIRPPQNPDWTLVILAGGRGLRAGGIDKGWANWRGAAMIHHLLQQFGRQSSSVIVSANRNLDAYRALGVTVVTDLRADFPGPLAGLEAALAVIDTPCQVILPCDMPLLPADLPQRLMQARHDDADISVAHDGIRQQHLCMALNGKYWRENLSTWLDQGGRSVHGWLADKPLCPVSCPDTGRAFTNLNQLNPEQN
ncbi:MAG: molybdenum cofactor guanylyltransferase [Alcanivoracaceae bacterium]|nr:molybdenum cofactor guanylyltransferase [Alcanivoracaceae bacterium]